MMNTKKVLSALVCLSLLAFSAQAEAKPKKVMAKQTEALVQKPPVVVNDKDDIARIENYLNNLKSLEAGFTQTNDNGDYRHGNIALKRPGKMRVTYDAPSKDFVVADGHFINMWDGSLESQTSVPIDSSLGDLILRDNIKLSGDITVESILHEPAKIEVTIYATKERNAGQLTFVFEDRPLKLRQWRIVDLQNFTTTVSLENAREGVELSDALFTFVSPNFGKNKRD